MTQPTNKPVGKDTQGDPSGSQSHRPVLRIAKAKRSKKALTPGYKALLVPEKLFQQLQKVQAGMAHPRRLSVADLSAACIALACEKNAEQEIIARASKIVAESMTTHAI
jgi:hypothetical protein